ncbi:MAG TPA: hypothetical protein VMS89_03620 [Methanoregulaceae archaeon]|nr:hypothetical protein [Methanoregulaceae archaeon]
MKEKTGFLSLIILTLCTAIIFAGCTGTAPAGQKTNTGTPAGVQVKTPDLIVPAIVPGFDLEVKDTNNTSMYPDEVASAATLYKPSLNSTYEGSVAYLTIYVDQFTNTSSAAVVYGTQNGSSLDIAGYPAKYNYDPDTGAGYFSVNNADMIIQSLALAPDNTTVINEAIIKDAAQKGMEAALHNI